MSRLPKFAIFDCDGTLVDSQHAIGVAMDHVWGLEGLVPPPRSEMRRQVGLPLEQAIANLHPDGTPAQFYRMADNCRYAFHDPAIQPMEDEPLFPGCRQVLQRLCDSGVILGVATGKGRRGLCATLERHGLRDYFQILKTADDGPGKPNPHILFDAMREACAAPADCVMIGDTVFDIGAAVNAEISSLGVSWGYHGPAELLQAGAAMIVDHYHQLPAALEKIWKWNLKGGQCADS